MIREILENDSLKLEKAVGVKYIWTDTGADPEWSFEEEVFDLNTEQRALNE